MNSRRHPVLTVLLVMILAMGLNLVASLTLSGCRLDMTANHQYTLSPGTKAILAGLEEPMTLTLYWSESTAKDLPQIQAHAQRVKEFLQDLVDLSDGKLSLEVVDPEPFSEAEDAAQAAGIAALQVDGVGTTLSLGLVVRNSIDETEVLPYLDPSKESFLEYDVVRAIHSLNLVEKPRVGLLSTLDMAGGFDPTAGPRGQMTPPWQVQQELSKVVELVPIQPDATALPDDLDALMVVHPHDLSPDLLESLDAWVLSAKPTLLCLDPHSEQAAVAAASAASNGMPPMTPFPSDLGDLLEKWGLGWDPDKVVLDRHWAQRVTTGRRASSGLETLDYLPWLGLKQEAFATEDPLVGSLEDLNLNSVGTFTLPEGSSLHLETLVHASADSALVPASKVSGIPDPSGLLRDFKPDEQSYPLAVRVTGELHSAYSDTSAEAGLLLMVADSDFLADQLWVREETLGPISLGVRRFADNGDFVLNMVDLMTGAKEMASLRGRGSGQRPFERVRELRQAAEAKYLAREKELQQEIQEGESRIRQMQTGRDEESGRLVLSAEQEAEVSRLQDRVLAARKELREVQHDLQKDIQALGTRLMLWNVLGTPALVALLVLCFSLWRRRRRQHAAL